VVRVWILILLKNPSFILREPQDERWSSEIIGNFPFMLSLVEAFLGFFSRISLDSSFPLGVDATFSTKDSPPRNL
jgi:hypothetical protein